MKAQKLSWRERRSGSNWSGTVYTGLLIKAGDKQVLVSNLSHGLRVLPKRVSSDYKFCGNPIEVEVTEKFVTAVWIAFRADIEFQLQINEFTKVMT